MAKWNLDYYHSKDKYSDGEIEDRILNFVKNKIPIETIYKKNMGYPMLYHLSPIRENILNWYPFKKEATLLEIGSGCGAITGMLCERTKEVVSVELSKRRGTINYERHKQYDNLEIIIGNLNDIRFKEKFDYIVLNGVLEYAGGYTKGEQPYKMFLKNVSTYLKPSGKLIIAIENRLGLKYFSGAAEEHTGHYFLGLNEYEENSAVKTFTKTELTHLLKENGFIYTRFYYPYPNYKFPDEIFTDETLLPNKYGKNYINLDKDRYQLFDDRKVSQAILQEGILSSLTDSFLVIASREDNIDKNILYAKLNMDRKPEFRLATVIAYYNGKKSVYKYPLSTKAACQIKQIEQNERREKNLIIPLKGKMKGEVIIYDFLEETSLDQYIDDCIKDKAANKIKEKIQDFFRKYLIDSSIIEDFYTKEFEEVFGTEKLEKKNMVCVQPANVDLISSNIFLNGNSYYVIDCEWIFDFYVPCSFLVWRMINELYYQKSELKILLPKEDMFELFEISEEEERIYRKWANHFAENYVGSNSIKNYIQPIYPFSLDEEFQRKKYQRYLCNSLYYDTGEGFCEEQKFYSEVKLQDGLFEVSYDLKEIKDIKRIRWDPVEGYFCRCEILQTNGIESIQPINAELTEANKSIFYTTDPIYEVHLNSHETRIEIRGRVEYLTSEEIMRLYMEQKQMNNNLKEENERIKHENIRLKRREEEVLETNL